MIVMSHAVLSPRACDGTTTVWDFAAALQTIQASGVVALVISGHHHNFHQSIQIPTDLHPTSNEPKKTKHVNTFNMQVNSVNT